VALERAELMRVGLVGCTKSPPMFCSQAKRGGAIVTAAAGDPAVAYDFVSRCFFAGIVSTRTRSSPGCQPPNGDAEGLGVAVGDGASLSIPTATSPVAGVDGLH
jgi:hypothetical protein